MSTLLSLRNILATLAMIIALFSVPFMVENLDATEIMVVQHPMGELAVHTTPGPKWQGFGKVTTYPRQGQYTFCSNTINKVVVLCPNADTTAKTLRFNDGGHADLSGAVMWEMPLDEKSIVAIHTTFGSPEGLQSRAVAKMLDGAIYLSGPLMSSTESSGARRAELVQYINDQAGKGLYITHSSAVTVKDPITGVDKTENVTVIDMKNGVPNRQQGSLLAEFNIGLQPMSISRLDYDNVVEKQIADRQQSITAVQNAKANSIRAEQDALTAETQGKARATTAKWEQEVIKAKEVTMAQQKLEVATLAAKEAEQYKKEQILRGEGDAQRKQLVMSADGALDQKLEAYKIVNGYYAEAIKSAHPGAWPPAVIMGSGTSQNGGGAQSLIDMFTAKTARDLGIDMSVAGKAATGKK